ncbi:MAG: hypothetical protein J2P37_00255 [Ktedonobacteraceae bacterium]|nr:hypothetical protein [Ktedonobacteraceae bacterium]
MGNERRSIQRVEVVDALDPMAERQARYDRKRDDLSQQMDRVQNTFKTLVIYVVLAVGSLLILVGMLTAMFGNLHQFLDTSSAFMQLLLKWFLPAVLSAVGLWLLSKLYRAWKAYKYDRLVEKRMQAEIDEIIAEIAREDKRVDADVERMRAEAAKMRAEAQERSARATQIMMTLPFDEQGNLAYRDPMTGLIQQYTGQMREHPLLTTFHNAPRSTEMIEERSSSQQQIASGKGIHIPTFAESMQAGLIGPGQKKVLICHELERDEMTGDLTGELRPWQDDLENNCTMFLGGASKSGKSTLMAHLAGQEAFMDALFYVIDPHLTHPERSIAAKIRPLSHAFILPPAQTDMEVLQVLEHGKAEAEARLNGRETRFSGRPIVFIVDEVLNLYARAQRTENPEIRALYRDLALFMRDLGTQYNKFGINGIFASQYVTKDAFRLPGASIDFRDGCQSQTLLRLPANQAQAMRLLDKDELKGIRQLPPGHGYMGFFTGDIIRMAAGNVTLQDLELAGRMLHAVPTARRYTPGTDMEPGGTRLNTGRTRVIEEDFRTTESVPAAGRNTGELENTFTPVVEPVEQGTEGVPEVPGTARQPKEFTNEQALEFMRKYAKEKSIKRTLMAMHLSYGDYQACASRLVQQMNMRKQ